MQTEFYSCTRESLESSLTSARLSSTHAKILFRNAYRRCQREPWRSSRVPAAVRKWADSTLSAPMLSLVSLNESTDDGSIKFIFSCSSDGAQIETVLIPERQRLTLCLSSQVGCAQGCVFCYTGRLGLSRHLTAAEIVGQVVAVNRWLIEHQDWLGRIGKPRGAQVGNIVFMGMGEPLDNIEALIPAVNILIDPYGLGLAPRRISVSTSGHLAGLEQFSAALPQIPVAFSLHAATDSLRSKLMPINKQWPLDDLRRCMQVMATRRRRPVFLQYTLIRGVNDSEAAAQALLDFLGDLPVKVNVIPFNDVAPSRFQTPSLAALDQFCGILHQGGVRTMVRHSKGRDINGACGQLALQT